MTMTSGDPADPADSGESLEDLTRPRVDGQGSRNAPVPRRQARVRERPLRVTVEVVAVDGPEGEALQQRQDAAIRAALAWLHAHPAEHPRGGDEGGRSAP
jgi:hypothetical protein